MIALIDPALLLPRAEGNWMDKLESELDDIVRACRRDKIRIIEFEYWQELWSSFGRVLERSLSPKAKRALQALRGLGEKMDADPDLSGVSVWRRGFSQLFGPDALGADLELTMAVSAAQAVLLDQDVVLLTRRIEGRNMTTLKVEHSTLHENTRWILHVQLKGVGHRTILCLYSVKTLQDRWTARYDWRLPSAQNASKYPFCPHDAWWKPSVTVVGTVSAKYAFIDRFGNGWARPNIPNGAGYHWDVFLRHQPHRESVGLDQINVVEFGAPPSEGACGSIHHVPAAKRSRIANEAGWKCC